MNTSNVSIWNICSILLDRHRRCVKRFDDDPGGPKSRLQEDGAARMAGVEKSPAQQSISRSCQGRIMGQGVYLNGGFEAAQQPWAEIFQLSLISGGAHEFF